MLRRAAGLLPFVVYVKPVRVRPPDFGARRAAALVLITEPGNMSRIDPARIAERLGLTWVESQVAAGVAAGWSCQCAPLRPLSPHYGGETGKKGP